MGSNSTCNNISNLNILYFNARSLLPKIDELRLTCETTKPDVVSIVKTWLASDISDNEIAIPGYNVTRLDRNRHGGGLLFYTKSCLYSQVLLQHPFDLEFVLFSISYSNFSYKIHIGLFYRPPSSPSVFMDFLYTSLQNIL